MDKSEIIKKSIKVGELYSLSELLYDNRLSNEQKAFVCSQMISITNDVENFLKRFAKGQPLQLPLFIRGENYG